MVSDEEFGHLVSEFESFRDIFIEEVTKLRTDIERLQQDLDDLKKELSSSGGITIKRRLG